MTSCAVPRYQTVRTIFSTIVQGDFDQILAVRTQDVALIEEIVSVM
jgi:hypothetical protein